MNQLEQFDPGLAKKQYHIISIHGNKISVWRNAVRNNKPKYSLAVSRAHSGAFIIKDMEMKSADLEK
jgi:hypothetical protein